MFNIFKKETQVTESRVLIIGDIHEPFTIDGYLEFCIEQYKKWNCNRVVFIGDVIDCHYSSFHQQDPDGMSAGDELNFAIKKLAKWYEAFPVAEIIIGNHDRIVNRKAFSAGLSAKWIRDYSEVLETPNWKFVPYQVIDDVLYIHGEGGTAITRAKNEFRSVVAGHSHTQLYVQWHCTPTKNVFGMQVGCGVDIKSYAMAYAQHYKIPALACGVVIDGTTPINLIF
jgi:metallophosphoesterase superfamily enzyme